MVDDHDLELEKQERMSILKDLKNKLSGSTDKKTKKILNEWMQGVSEGTEHEAQQLLAFFRAWHSANSLPSGRVLRDNAVNCGLSRAVDLHFTALNMKQKVIGTTSLDLLRWVMYGHWGRTRREKQEDDFKKMVRAEAVYEHETGKKMSLRKLAGDTEIDRKKARKIREKQEYQRSFKVIKAVLKKSYN